MKRFENNKTGRKLIGDSNKRWASPVIIIGGVLILIMGMVVFSNIFSGKSLAGNVKNSLVKNNDLIIQVSEITEKAQFYPVEIDGTKLEVLAVKAPDGTIRTAFNTCQVCFGSGRGYYVQEGDALVCQNCGNRFGMADVEVTRGGCNPVPIAESDKTVGDTSITISKEFLAEAKIIFANWKN